MAFSEENKADCLENQALLACLEVGKLLSSTVAMEEVLALIMDKVSQLIQAGNWSLLLTDEETGELVFEIVVGEKQEELLGLRLPSGQGVAGHAAETKKPQVVREVRRDPRFYSGMDNTTGFVTEMLIAVPLVAQDKTLGVIEVVNIRDMKDFDAHQLPVLKILADYAAIAIEKARYFARIEKMSLTDEYTGLYNARYMRRFLEKTIEEARDQGKSFAVVFVDVDNFKNIVDTRGHLSGSQVLKQVGLAIESRLSKKDVLIKYGGDEYVIILPGCGRKEAKEIIEKARQAVRESRFLDTGEDAVAVTASFGIAMFPDDARDLEDLLKLADQRLYRIKRSTKDGIA